MAPGVYGVFTARNCPVSLIVQYAYNARLDRVLGAPRWFNDDKYDINAKAPRPGEPYRLEQIQYMMQTLLEDRFKLKVHRETRDVPVYALVTAKGGPKLTAARKSNCFEATIASKPSDAAGRPLCGSIFGSRGDLHAADTRMLALANQLERFLDRPVMDDTGLQDHEHDFDLWWAPSEMSALPPAAADSASGSPQANPADAAGPSLFTALEEQLGLRLESRKGPVEVLVIDYADRPSEN